MSILTRKFLGGNLLERDRSHLMTSIFFTLLRLRTVTHPRLIWSDSRDVIDERLMCFGVICYFDISELLRNKMYDMLRTRSFGFIPLLLLEFCWSSEKSGSGFRKWRGERTPESRLPHRSKNHLLVVLVRTYVHLSLYNACVHVITWSNLSAINKDETLIMMMTLFSPLECFWLWQGHQHQREPLLTLRTQRDRW